MERRNWWCMKVTVRFVNVAKSSRFGLSKTDNGQDNRPRLRERATSSTWFCTNGKVGSRLGGTGTPMCGQVKHELNEFPLGWY